MARQKWLTDTEKQLIEDAIRRGCKQVTIAQVFGRSDSTVKKIAAKMGATKPRAPKPDGPLLQLMRGADEG